MTDTTTRCGDTRDEYTCTLKPHLPGIDHADQVVAPGGIMAASYTRAFWNTDKPLTVVDPYAKAATASPHAGCVNCPHAADEHNRRGCGALDGNTANPCPCVGWTPQAAVDVATPLDGEDMIGLATEVDLVTALPRRCVIGALQVALRVLDDSEPDDEWRLPLAAILDYHGVTAEHRDAIHAALRELS